MFDLLTKWGIGIPWGGRGLRSTLNFSQTSHSDFPSYLMKEMITLLNLTIFPADQCLQKKDLR